MKKQTKLSLNKFKIAKISKFEQGKVVGGLTGVDGDGDDTGTRTLNPNGNGGNSKHKRGNTKCADYGGI